MAAWNRFLFKLFLVGGQGHHLNETLKIPLASASRVAAPSSRSLPVEVPAVPLIIGLGLKKEA